MSDAISSPSTRMPVSPACVLGVVLRSNQGDRRLVLVGVRRPSTNERHPGVVSLPTMRIPASIGGLLGMMDEAGAPLDGVLHRVAGPDDAFGGSGTAQSLTGYLVESVLSRKLGVAVALEERRIRGRCRLAMIGEADVDDPGGTGSSEPTRMYTVVAEITHGADAIPGSTASYSRLGWIDAETLIRSWDERDAQALFPDADPVEICIRGLCIQSGVALLRAERNRDATHHED